jgi:hypothetical protein
MHFRTQVNRLAKVFCFLLVLSILAFSLPAAPASATPPITITAAYVDMGAASGAFRLNSDATAISGSPGYIRLTRDAEDLWGTAFRKNKVAMQSNFAFNSYFTFQIIPSIYRADGMVFVIQGSTNTAGGVGEDLGTTGIYPMFGVEFDTYQNTDLGDPNNNHIAIIHGISPNGIGNANHTLPGQGTPVALNPTTQVDLADGNVHHCWIEYDGTNVHVRIGSSNNRSAATEYLNQPYNIASLFSSRDMYFGFTSSTGGQYEEHRIISCYFNNSDIGGIDTSTNTYTSGPASITVTASPTNVAADKTSQVCALVKDELGNAMAGQTINFTATLGNLSPISTVSNASGYACVNLTGNGTVGTSTVLASQANGAFGTGNVSFFAAPPPPPKKTSFIVTAPPHSSSGGGMLSNSYSPPVPLPNITVENISLSSAKVGPGAPITVTAYVANKGTANGSSQIKLYVNGQEEAHQGVTLPSGSNTPIKFIVSRDEPGTYSVYVGSIAAGSFEVDGFADPNLILYISGALLLFALAGGVIFMATRKPR